MRIGFVVFLSLPVNTEDTMQSRSDRLPKMLPCLSAVLAAFTTFLALVACGCGGSSAADSSPTAPAQATTPTVTVTSQTYTTLGSPYQALPLSNGDVLVSVTADGTMGSETGVQVFTPTSGGLQASCVNQLSPTLIGEGAAMGNLDLTPNGVNVGGGIGDPGAMFWNLTALEDCTASGVVLSQGPISADELALEAVVAPDGKYAFVIDEDGIAPGATFEGNVAVVQLQTDANGNVTGGTLLGQISTGGAAIAGIAMSPDGSRVYLATGVAGVNTSTSGGNNPVLARTNCPNLTGGPQINGLLTVIDVAAAEANPGPGAILATVDAGCTPVRIVESANESVLWVTARGDNRVLAFSPSMLESNPNNALLGYADTGGTAPVGLALFNDDRLLAVANSNRFNTGTANATILYVANPASPVVVQTISTGTFPREFRVGADDATLYLTNFDSDTLQIVKTTVN